jgi:anti-anti-sigma factor
VDSLVINYQPEHAAAIETQALEALASGVERVILDLDSVPVLDVMAVRSLIALLRRAREHGGDIALHASRPDVLRTLSVTALDRIFNLVKLEAA